jgi:hypothetical protein
MAVEYDEDTANEFLKGEPEDSKKRKVFQYIFDSVTKTSEFALKSAEVYSLNVSEKEKGWFKKYFLYNVAICLIFNAGYDKEFLDEHIQSAKTQFDNIMAKKQNQKKE